MLWVCCCMPLNNQWTTSLWKEGLDTQSPQCMKRRLSVTNFSLENNLPTFRLNAPVVIRAKVKKYEQKLQFIAMHYWGYTSLEVKGQWGFLLPPCLPIKPHHHVHACRFMHLAIVKQHTCTHCLHSRRVLMRTQEAGKKKLDFEIWGGET